MKKILSIVQCNNAESELILPDDRAELLRLDGQNAADNPKALYELIKQTKGKYIVLTDADFTVNASDFDGFLKAVDECSADILTFDGGCALKATTLKGVPAKLYCDKSGAEIYAAFNSKEISGADLKPFSFTPQIPLHAADETSLEGVLDEFKRSKAKLSKTVYSYIFDILCARLTVFYASGLVAIYRKEAPADGLIEFDKKLKDNIVLYLALEKRFTFTDLKKLREKDFKINIFTYNKLKKFLKK